MFVTPTIGPTDGLPRRERREALTAISVAVAMATLDTAVTNTVLPTIAGAVGATGPATIWVVNAYQIAMVGALLPLASLGEIVGQQRVYVAGLTLFTVTSIACGLSWSLASLVAARALQGLGAAAIMSVNTSLIRFVYPAEMLGRGVGLNALVVGVGFTVGPTVASAILSVGSWHWLFLINVPAGSVAIFLSLRSLPRIARAKHPFDSVAAILCAAFFALMVYGMVRISQGSSWLPVLADWSVALVCGAALVRRQKTHSAPMLATDLFRQPSFALSTVTSVCSFATQGLAFVSLPFLFQTVLGHSAVTTGLLITPWPAAVAIMAPVAGRLADRYPAGLLGGCGLLGLCAGMTGLALLRGNPTIAEVVCPMIVCGIGFGLFQSPNLRALMASTPPNRSGSASGIVAVARLVGQATGAALVALCLTVSQERGPLLALWLGCAFSGLGSLASFSRLLLTKRRT